MNDTYLVVALGNPGASYRLTRHNAGWIALDEAFADLVWDFNGYAQADCAERDGIIFIKPQTFMNLSGEGIRYFIEKKDIIPEHIIVLYDDIDLPIGTVRISYDRGSGGHNGIRSIEQHVGGKNFIRIRIGISKVIDEELVKPNVLGTFESEELETLKKSSEKVASIIKTITTEGKDAAMNMFNGSEK